MVSNRLAGALAAPAVGTKPDGRLRPTLISASRAHWKKKLGLTWAGACAGLKGSLEGLRLTLGLGSTHDQCPPTSQNDSQNDSRGILRPRDDDQREEEPQTRRMVQSMRPVLPYLVDTGQAAFHPVWLQATKEALAAVTCVS